jgi:hypothetical protein
MMRKIDPSFAEALDLLKRKYNMIIPGNVLINCMLS